MGAFLLGNSTAPETAKKKILVNLIIHDCQFKPAASPRFYLNFTLGQLPVIFLSFASSIYFLFESYKQVPVKSGFFLVVSCRCTV